MNGKMPMPTFLSSFFDFIFSDSTIYLHGQLVSIVENTAQRNPGTQPILVCAHSSPLVATLG
jgi:hypothetical protein